MAPAAQPIRVHPGRDATLLTRLTETLADAFAEDPHINWIVRQDARRDASRRDLFRLLLTDLLGAAGEVHATQDGQACAIWFPPGGWRLGLFRQVSIARRFIAVSGWPAAVVKAYGLNRAEKARPPGSHAFLQTIGVRSDMRGRGCGDALMRQFRQYCEHLQASGYLETANPANIAFYERHGFRIVGETGLPCGPTLFQMMQSRP